MRDFLAVIFPCTALLCVLACSSSTPTASGDPDSGALDAAASNDAAEADAEPNPQCNSFAQQGEVVSATGSASQAPKPMGGATVDGTYVLTAVVGYGSAQAIAYQNRSTLQVRGLVVNVVEDTGQGDKRKTGSGTVDNTTLTLTETCAFPKRRLLIEQAAFTATDTEILLYGPVGNLTLVQTYTKK